VKTNSSTTVTAKSGPTSTAWTQRLNHWFEYHWLLTFNAGWGIFVTLPFLAPVLMALGLTLPARVLYTVYSFLCHQLPERSWFLFGPQLSYTQAQIAAAWGVPVADISHEMIRRQFIGAPELGWKIAWSDRMVAMYGSIFLCGLLYALLRQWGIKPRSLPWPWLLILIVPMAIDGTTHLINDTLRLDFRDLNLWAMWLTGGLFPPQFYGGDMFGSLNSLLRLTTGLLFGLGIVGFLWPLMDREFSPRR
jgi:uncharacterized membrane protein